MVIGSMGTSVASTIQVCVTPLFLCSWPRPQRVDGVDMVELVIRRDLKIDVTALAKLSPTLGPKACVDWLRRLGPYIVTEGDTSKIRFGDLMASGMMRKECYSLCSQVLWQTSLALEALLLERELQADDLYTVTASYDDDEDGMDLPHLLDQRLVKYNAAGKDETKGHLNFYFATDKAWVGGLPLVATVIALNNNKAFIAVPVVGEPSYTPQGVYTTQLGGPNVVFPCF
jgi:hypothetical protein